MAAMAGTPKLVQKTVQQQKREDARQKKFKGHPKDAEQS